jgi:hypothetical protein
MILFDDREARKEKSLTSALLIGPNTGIIRDNIIRGGSKFIGYWSLDHRDHREGVEDFFSKIK